MINQLEFVYLDEPFKICELPLDKVYVIDNYLSDELHHHIDNLFTRTSIWSKTNQVGGDNPTGLPMHSFWGASFLRGDNLEGDIDRLDAAVPIWFNRKLQTDFEFEWVRFQYAGLNSQTHGCHGTTHSDCDDHDDWNLSFLYYYNRFWNPKWGGTLRIYDSPQQGLQGRNEHIKNHQIAEVEFVPNRLVLFDGRIPHGADAPNESARYMDRRSIVIRGDEVKLTDRRTKYSADDRIPFIRYGNG